MEQLRRPRIICVANKKGGVGKSTTSRNLGLVLASKGYKVLLGDLDPQTNLTASLVDWSDYQKREAAGLTLYDAFFEALPENQYLPKRFDIRKAIIKNVDGNMTAKYGYPIRGLDLLPSSFRLDEIMHRLPSIGKDTIAVRSIDVLKRHLTPEVLAEYDYVIFDCRPELDIIPQNGLNLADYYVIPVKADVQSTWGLPQCIKTVKKFSEDTMRPIKCLGIIINEFRSVAGVYKGHRALLEKDLAMPPVFKTAIPERASIASANDTSINGTLGQKFGYDADGIDLWNRLTDEFIAKLDAAEGVKVP